MGNIYTCGPNEVVVVSGGCGRGTNKKYIIGGATFAWWLVSDVQRLSLELITVYPYCIDVETSFGVAITVHAVAQCKVMKDIPFLKLAAEQFLGKDIHIIKQNVCNTLEGSLRTIIGLLTVEEVYKDREMFSKRVCEIAAPDMARMGIMIISFTITDISDHINYLKSLGKAQIAAVKRDAAIGVAEAERDAGIRESECLREAQEVILEMNTRIENNSKKFLLAKASYDQEINAAKAEAALAYELQEAKVKQDIRKEEVHIQIIERKKTAEVEGKEVERMDKELISMIRLPSEADSYMITTIAEGNKCKTSNEGKAHAQKMKLLGESEANVVKMVGNAEAEMMLLKANVFKNYGQSAILSLVLQYIPIITSQITMPLRNIDEIVIIQGSDGVTADLNRLFGQIPPSLSAIAGQTLSGLLNK